MARPPELTLDESSSAGSPRQSPGLDFQPRSTTSASNPSNFSWDAPPRRRSRLESDESDLRRLSPSSRSMEGARLDRNESSKSCKRRSVSLSGKFIKAKSNLQQLELQEETDFKTRQKRMVGRVLKSIYVSNFMVALVLFDAYCTCADIDSRAVGKATPKEFAIFSDLCLVMYTIELFLNMAVKGREIFMDWTMILDVVIIMCGYGEFLLTLFADNDLVLSMGMFRAFRLARIVRLMRLLRKTRALRELQKLVTMMATCLKALVWSSVFCFFIMSVWAMFMVEVVHPIISEPGLFDDCVQCQTAAGSVMNANLLLFKTVIAGDSWGLIAVPVIQAYPATAFIFIGSQVTLVFGVLNLIVAVVVDTFAEARQRDILNLAEELEYDFDLLVQMGTIRAAEAARRLAPAGAG